MTEIEEKAAVALINCSFLPGTYDKKFCRQLANWYDRKMTPEGRAMMIKMVQKYRRQINNAEQLINDLIATTPTSHGKRTEGPRRTERSGPIDSTNATGTVHGEPTTEI